MNKVEFLLIEKDRLTSIITDHQRMVNLIETEINDHEASISQSTRGLQNIKDLIKFYNSKLFELQAELENE